MFFVEVRIDARLRSKQGHGGKTPIKCMSTAFLRLKIRQLNPVFSFWEGTSQTHPSLTLLLVSGFLGAPLRPRAMGHPVLLRWRFVGIPADYGLCRFKKPAQQVSQKVFFINSAINLRKQKKR